VWSTKSIKEIEFYTCPNSTPAFTDVTNDCTKLYYIYNTIKAT